MELNYDNLEGQVFTHHSGRQYKLLHVANKLSTDLNKFPILAVYESVIDKVIWSRPMDEFNANFVLDL